MGKPRRSSKLPALFALPHREASHVRKRLQHVPAIKNRRRIGNKRAASNVIAHAHLQIRRAKAFTRCTLVQQQLGEIGIPLFHRRLEQATEAISVERKGVRQARCRINSAQTYGCIAQVEDVGIG